MAKKKSKSKPKKKSKRFDVLLSPEEQLEALKRQYGTNINYVDVKMHMTFSEVEKHFGPECEEFHPLCGCCHAWYEWHHSKQVTVILERDQILKALND